MFGHDGMLYLTSGDGTTDSDGGVTGQDLSDLLGGFRSRFDFSLVVHVLTRQRLISVCRNAVAFDLAVQGRVFQIENPRRF